MSAFHLASSKFLTSVVPLLDQRIVQRIAFHSIAANPRLARRAAPRVVDQADRHIELIVQLAAKEIADGRKALRRFRRANFPLAVEILDRRLAARLLHAHETNLRMIGGRNFQVAVRRQRQRPLHIRLARAEPHFADEDVVHLQPILAAFDDQLQRLADRQRLERHAPIALVVGLRLCAFARRSTTCTSSPGSAEPHTGTGMSRCSTA